MKRVVVLGAGSQLGRCIKDWDSYMHPDLELIYYRREDLDITNYKSLEAVIVTLKPDIVINCAAYTNVVEAEQIHHQQEVLEVNCVAVGKLAELCEYIGCKLIHISTDYVFGNFHNKPILEHDLPEPINFYGSSKRKGEIKIAKVDCDYIILRTSWLYSSYNNNFVNKVYETLYGYNTVSVVTDEVGSPTYCLDLVKAIMKICLDDKLLRKKGIYHYCNLGSASRYDLAYAIGEYLGCQDLVLPIYNNKPTFPRPHYSVLDVGRTSIEFGFGFNHWKSSLYKYLGSKRKL